MCAVCVGTVGNEVCDISEFDICDQGDGHFFCFQLYSREDIVLFLSVLSNVFRI